MLLSHQEVSLFCAATIQTRSQDNSQRIYNGLRASPPQLSCVQTCISHKRSPLSTLGEASCSSRRTISVWFLQIKAQQDQDLDLNSGSSQPSDCKTLPLSKLRGTSGTFSVKNKQTTICQFNAVYLYLQCFSTLRL